MCAIIKNPLQRDGTSQQDRLAKALLPGYAKIDDRKIEEIIAFASEYAKLLNYYNGSDKIDGDWSCFYENDRCIMLALLATIDTDSIEDAFKKLEEKTERYLSKDYEPEPEEEEKEDTLAIYYDEIINQIYTVALRIHKACKKLPAQHPLKEEIIALIKTDLHLAIIDNKQQDALIKLIGYDKASLEPVNDYSPFKKPGQKSTCECTNAWNIDQEKYDCIFPDTAYDLASLKVLFYIFFIVLVHIKQRAKTYFEECIEKNDEHQPHITLFLTFIYLFQHAIDHLNSLTRSHLLYYYEKVLCLHKLKEVPDKVHIIFELAKNFDTHLVEERTGLNAAKDDTGKLRVFELLEEVVVNKAKVEQIKSVYIDQADPAPNTQKTKNAMAAKTALAGGKGVVHAASMADSKDGLGETFSKEEQPHWTPLGGPAGPATELGFATASPMFFLKEGFRAAMLTYHFEGITARSMVDAGGFRFMYSSGKEWVEVENVFDAINRIVTETKYPNLYKIHEKWLTDEWLRDGIDAAFNYLKDKYADHYGFNESNASQKSEDKRHIIQDVILSILKNILKNDFSRVADMLNSNADFNGLPGLDKDAILKELLLLRSDVLALKNVYITRMGDVLQKDSKKEKRVDMDCLILANSTSPAFAPLIVDEKNPGITSPWPLVKALVKNEDVAGNLSSQYVNIKNLRITGVDIKVAVYGLKDLVVQNDAAILDNSKEILPFSNSPYVNSYFLVGSKEAFQKKLDFVALQLDWADKPAAFNTYYSNYITTVNDNSFRVNAEVLNGGIYQPVLGGNDQNLFDQGLFDKSFIVLGQTEEVDEKEEEEKEDGSNNTGAPITGMVKSQKTGENRFELRSFARDPYLPDFTDYNVNLSRGFMRLALTPQDFLHGEYPIAYTQKVASLGAQLKTTDLPKEPYTPKLKNASLIYASTERILFGTGLYSTNVEEFFHITPFGYEQMEISVLPEIYLLPQFELLAKNAGSLNTSLVTLSTNVLTDTDKQELFSQGNMYIGLKDAKPEQKVNILFQVLEGSGDNRYAPPDIEWSWLMNNEWKAFKPFEIEDHTRADESSRKSLLKSGIIEFSLPKDITSELTTILDSKYLWIRAAANENPVTPEDSNLQPGIEKIAALPDLVAIIAQAGLAEFTNQNNSLSHLASPLPAKTISKFIDSRAAIKSVKQPYNSFDGRLPENDSQFYRRISERLRHKNRAICIWDYERLVLQQFPQVHKVKCLNHTGIVKRTNPTVYGFEEIAPGFVTISVIPDLRNRNATNKIEPRVPVGLLDEIKLFLKKRTNLFVASPYIDSLDYLQVLNPLYEQIKVKSCVRFHTGLDVAYYKYVLNEDLKKFLSPWAFNANTEINFGSVYQKSAILNFIEERKYVDVVLGFSVEHYKDGVLQPDFDADLIIPTTSRSILTSFNVTNISEIGTDHTIEFIPYTEAAPCPTCPV